ncbi:GWxTD domain-containing protein [candidate division KSB1 bacterium]|nr:GWxTD domain-containing protein [candidate division KSB1 bacterium]
MRLLSKIWGAVFPLLVCLSPVSGRPALGDHRFEVDYAQFRMGGEYVCLEVYYSIFREGLKFVQDKEGNYRANFNITAQIYRGDSLLVEESWDNVNYAKDLDEIGPGQRLPNISKFRIKAGNYRLRVTVTDLHSGISASQEEGVTIVPFDPDHLAISDLELSTTIQKDTSQSKFCKNNFRVIPNPGRLYGTDFTLVYYYAEIYNLDYKGSGDSCFSVTYRVLDSNLKEVKTYPAKVRKKAGSSAVEVGALPIAVLASGSFFLDIGVTDISTGETASVRKKFFVYRQADFAGAGLKEENIYAQMGEDQIAEQFDRIRYIIGRDGKKMFGDLPLNGKRQFLYQFWCSRDPDPTTPINEYQVEFQRRFDQANTKFSGLREGWRSDRGRVLIVYGNPDFIEHHTAEPGVRDYEIWQYDSLEGGVVFVFADRSGFGDYELIHSTKKDELHNYNWPSLIQVERSPMGPAISR